MSEKIIPFRCFAGDCKWRVQGKNCVHCSHKDKIVYHKLKEPCQVCGRPVGQNSNGCGACIGRGQYIYPVAYDNCDCKGYEQKK